VCRFLFPENEKNIIYRSYQHSRLRILCVKGIQALAERVEHDRGYFPARPISVLVAFSLESRKARRDRPSLGLTASSFVY